MGVRQCDMLAHKGFNFISTLKCYTGDKNSNLKMKGPRDSHFQNAVL